MLKRTAEDKNIQIVPCKIQIKGCASLNSFAAGRQGERDDMQDAHINLDNCISEFSQLLPTFDRVAFYGVFDGHGGSRASKFCSKRLFEILIEKVPTGDSKLFEKEIKKAICESFKAVDSEFLKQASMQKPAWKDGTTVCSVLVLNDKMYIMNLGDSKAILCRFNEESKENKPIILSKDHNPTNYEERQRIQKAGGQVREGRVMGILEVSRSIGDGQYKTCGVSNIPDIKRCTLNANDRFILIACDGLWKVFKPQEAIDFVFDVLQDDTIKNPDKSKSLEETLFEAACNKLASEAVRKGSGDNVTVLLISVNKL